MADRMDLADAWADGIVSAFLPMSVENVDTEAGRYDWKNVLDTSYEVMLYEPRMAQTLVGEHHEFVGTVPFVGPDPGFNPFYCDGTYTLEWDVTVEEDTPTLHWYADHVDGGTGATTPLEDGIVEDDAADLIYDPTDPVEIIAGSGDEFHVYWDNEGGGATPDDANRAHFRVVPPDSACALQWEQTTVRDNTIETEAETDLLTTTVSDVYDCITSWFTTGTCP